MMRNSQGRNSSPSSPSKRPDARRSGPFQRLGPLATVLAISGLFVGTLIVALIVSMTIRVLIATDALNPFGRDTGPGAGSAQATPNTAFMAPTVDLGNQHPWQGNEPVIILLLGADTRPSEEGEGRPRTDSLMLLMADPVNHRASILSIPRDLFVDIPGYGLNRINTAYPLGGSQLAVETVQYNLGLRVNHYILIEFNVFVALVDQIGGIDLDVPSPISDPDYPSYDFGYDPFYLSAGPQHLDGETALKYARTRHNSSDFNRAKRQQAVLFAIREKALKPEIWPGLIQQAPQTYATLQEHVITDLTLDQMISLAVLAQDIPADSIRTGVIDENYVIGYETSEGAQVEIPNRANIGQLLSYVFWLQ